MQKTATPQTVTANVISRRLKEAGHFRYLFAHGFTASKIADGIVEIAVLGYSTTGRDEELDAITATLTSLGYNATTRERHYRVSPTRMGSYPVVHVTA